MQEGALNGDAEFVEAGVFAHVGVSGNAAAVISAQPEAIMGLPFTQNFALMAFHKHMRFVGRGYTTSFSISMMSLSPEKRALLYDVFDALHPLANTAEEKRTEQAIGQGPLLAARVLKNFDKVAALQNAGQLDRAHLVPILYSDLDVQPNATNEQIDEAYSMKLASNAKIMGALHMLLEASGTTVDEAVDAIADEAYTQKTGARGLRTIMEKAMMDVMFTIPSDDSVQECIITKDVIEGKAQPTIVR